MALSDLPILNTTPREWVFLVGFPSAMMGFIFIILLIRQEAWRLVAGVASTVVGLVCYALSSSFNDLFGNWNWWKIILYIIFSFMVLILVCSAKLWRNLSFLRDKSQVMFLILGSTTIYSFFSDRALQGKPDAYNLVSYAAFAIMSFSCGFVELMYFFSALVTSQLMKIDLLLGFVGMCFSYFLIVFPKSGLQLEPSYLEISQWRKQRVWKLVIVASTGIALVSLPLIHYFKFSLLSGELNSINSSLKILFWIALFACGSYLSYSVLFKVTGGHLVFPQFNFHTGYLVSCLATTSAYCIFFSDSNSSVRNKEEAYSLACITASCVLMLGFPKLQGRYMLGFIYIGVVAPVTLMMLINPWLGFVGIGLSYVPFILHSYIDATTDQASSQSNTEDQYQVITKLASPPPYSDNEQSLAVIEVELASLQSNSESRLQEVTQIHLPQFSEGESSQVVINKTSTQQFTEAESQLVSEVDSPQGSNEDQSDVFVEIASRESHVLA